MGAMKSWDPGPPGDRLALLVALVLLVACRPSGPLPTRSEANTPQTGVLHVWSTPQGAELRINGERCGMTPAELELPAGSVHVVLSREGYSPWQGDYYLAAGSTLTVTGTLRDVAPPVLTFVDLPACAQAGERVPLQVQASDNDKVVWLSLMLDGRSLATSVTGTLSHEWETASLAPGSYVLVAEAADQVGNRARAEAQVEIVGAETISATETDTPARPAVLSTPIPDAVAISHGSITLQSYGYLKALRAEEGSACYPYPRLDRGLIGPLTTVTFDAVVLQNEYLRLVFLPALGGRLYQCTYLPTGQNLFYNNAVLKPSPWGPPEMGWWLAAGGMEWCLPVEEHGYVSAEPWEATTTQTPDGSAAITLTHIERTHNLRAAVTISLAPDEARFRVGVHLENLDAQPKTFQFWLNAMVALDNQSLPPDTRFVLPAAQVIVHSTGDNVLGAPHTVLAWPLADGRNLSYYETWRNWLGVFAPQVSAGFAGVYAPENDLGLVRVFDPAQAPGVKLFAFGGGIDPGTYTDDGSEYAELWGGLTPTFWDYVTIPGNGSAGWSEIWLPFHGLGGLSSATDQIILAAAWDETPPRVAITSPKRCHVTIVVADEAGEMLRQETIIAPEQPFSATIEPGRALAGRPVLRVLDPYGKLLAQYQAPS